MTKAHCNSGLRCHGAGRLLRLRDPYAVIEPERARAFTASSAHYADVFGNGRTEYAIPEGAVSDPERQHRLAAFFFWTSWAAVTNRPGDSVTYTSNWPHEKLVGNRPTSEAIVWTGVSILVLLAGIGAMAFWHATQKPEPQATTFRPKIRLLGSRAAFSAPSPQHFLLDGYRAHPGR